MKFSKEDCVRSGIVAKILQTYNYNGGQHRAGLRGKLLWRLKELLGL